MPILRPTTVATLWPRHILLTDPYRGWQLLDRSDENIAMLLALATEQPCALPDSIEDFTSNNGLPDEGELTPAQRIRDLDRLYSNAVPGLSEAIELDAGMASSLNQRLRVRELSDHLALSLPTSVGRLARILRAQGSGAIYLDQDPNGLGVILGHTHRVTIRATNPVHNMWLAMQIEAESFSTPPTLVNSASPSTDHTTALCYATTPHETFLGIERARKACGERGTIALLARRSYDQWLYTWLSDNQVKISDSYREIDHWLIPDGFCPDYPADLILLQEFPGDLTAPRMGEREALKEQPALIIDMERLSKPLTTPESLSEFADLLEGLAPEAEISRSIHIEPDLWTLNWNSQSGAGLTLQVRPDWLYATLSLMPYDLGLERAVMHSAMLTWADGYTRLDPVRTYWCGKESVFA